MSDWQLAVRRFKSVWPMLLAAAGLLWIFFAIQLFLGFQTWLLPITWREAFRWALPDALLWIFSILVVIKLGQRIPLHGKWLVPLLVHVAASGAISFSTLGLRALFEELSGWSLGAPNLLLNKSFFRMGISFPSGIMLYWIVIGAMHALNYYERLRERDVKLSRLETELARAQLDVLKMQLHPHFLFNTMNSIAVLMRRDVNAAERMLTQLSDLLRLTLDNSGRQEVPLRHELDFLRTYVDIQQTRFQDRLTVTFDIDPEVLGASVPSLVLQPLVENAIQHGIAPRAAPGNVVVSARLEMNRVLLQVADDGVGMTQNGDGDGREGVGLANTCSRLDKLYGDGHEFTATARPGGGSLVSVWIPYREAPDDTLPEAQ